MSEEPSTNERPPFSELTLAYWLLRLWLGLRLLLSGVEKFKTEGKLEYKFSNYYDVFVKKTAPVMADNTLLPEIAVKSFLLPLGYLMIAAGFFILIGFLNRLSLLLGGLIFVSLSFGMMLLPDPHQTLDLGLYVALFAGALALVKHNKLGLTRW